MPFLEQENPVIDWVKKSLELRRTYNQPPVSKPPPRRRLPAILPTKIMNLKHDQLIAFTVVDVTELKTAIESHLTY